MGEVGVFIRAVSAAKAIDHKYAMLTAWHAHHLDGKEMKTFLKELDKKGAKRDKGGTDDSQKNWKEMKAFFGGLV